MSSEDTRVHTQFVEYDTDPRARRWGSARAGGPARSGADMMNNGDKLLFSVKEASELLGVGSGLVYEMVRKDEIPHIRLGRLVKIPRQGL